MTSTNESSTPTTNTTFVVESPHVIYDEEKITSTYSYQTSHVTTSTTTNATDNGNSNSKKEIKLTVTPITETLLFQTNRKIPKLGLMLVGWGGNNGTTVTAGILANKYHINWNTKEGLHKPNYFGSLTQSSVISLGISSPSPSPSTSPSSPEGSGMCGGGGESIYLPMNQLLPMVHPNDIILGGWDISSMNLGDAMYRAKVLDYDLMRQLYPYMKDLKPLPSIYCEDFIALNQKDRADNVLLGDATATKDETSQKWVQVERIRQDIRHFKEINECDEVIVLWTATTERFSEILPGIHDTADNILNAVKANHNELSPSTLFAIASILEGSAYINGSPQNTFVPGIIELANRHNTFIVGDDFKSGQTKMKSVLVDFLVSAGLKPTSIVSYNHLGNNDGKNLSAPEQFRSKEITKSNVVDDMVASNGILYNQDIKEHPDHVVVIKYVPYVGDSKRAMDEYTSEIFLGGRNTIVMHNTCEDSLLASPLIYDLAILTELCQRIKVKRITSAAGATGATSTSTEFESFHPVLSLLSYLMKAPLVPPGTPVVNALAAQRQCIVNVLKACVGLPPDNYMTLEHKIPSMMFNTTSDGRKRKAEDGIN